ncbi:MAG TPA: GPW/gp25 family protein [Bosea sp. (in: a-proteobacteria)]|jgi:type VI secretion system protein ImpF|uniref:GPW/gp25 family protein n=1 Tax=Bosea sp. (in: a-proteobacteria) TaxID=1871050 RepID=UPI002DDD8F8F|nr:GPW/gp25 family protein [Bosea sp. (in: a-proteobacteria)]HEV2555665.1 GPW/gp25 family protein [Bosea sp. (in: a-proteobacteria)]
MNGTLTKKRLRPPLMFAFREAHQEKDAQVALDLRDAGGERVIANRRAAPRAAITEPKLRREIAVDLDALVNTINLGSSVDLSRYEHVRKSILNHGFPDLTSRSIDEHRVDLIAKDMVAALLGYEPRLIRNSIAVERDHSLDRAELKVRFLVRADLNCEPLNVPVEFVADLELDTGKMAIRNR